MDGRVVAEIGKALGDVLARTSYDEQTVRDLIRVDNLDVGRGLAVLQLRASGSEPLGLLVRLFLAAESIDPDAAAAALAPVTLPQLVAAGIIEEGPEGVRSLVRLDPVDGLVVASDTQRRGEGFVANHVIGVGPLHGHSQLSRRARRTRPLSTSVAAQASKRSSPHATAQQ